LLDRQIFLSGPRIDNAKIFYDEGSSDRVLSNRKQFAGAAALADSLLFSPQTGVNQTKHAEWRPIVGLLAHCPLHFGARRGKGFPRPRVVSLKNTGDPTLQ
jgi:hypothetical protein